MVRVKAPATSANLGPGYDTLGMALQFYNYFEAHTSDALTVTLSPHTCVDTTGLSLDPTSNLLAQAYTRYYQSRQEAVKPAELVIEAHIPLSRGLGSSSSAIAAGLLLADHLHTDPLGKDKLLPLAIDIEGHPDNVVPALLGGVHCCLSHGDSLALTWPESWGIILVIPPQPLSTQQARQVMPDTYIPTDVVENIRGMATWIYAIENEDTAKFAYALHTDTLHEPVRGPLIPEYTVVKTHLKTTDAMGCVISGSGSTIAAFTPDASSQKSVLTSLKALEELAHCTIISVKPDTTGSVIVAS